MERVQVAVVSLWLFVIAAQLYADRRRPPLREASDPPGHRTPRGRPGTRPNTAARGTAVRREASHGGRET